MAAQPTGLFFRAGLIALALTGIFGSALAQPLAQQGGKPNPASMAAYAAGLDALRDGNFAQAETRLAEAMQNSDDPEIVLAHGVSLVLSEKFKQALPDLQRAQKLGLRSREPELWTYAAESMGHFATRDHIMGGPLRLRDGRELADGEEVSVPGNIIQGRNDYNTAYANTIIYEMAYPYGFERRVGKPVDMNKVRAAQLKAGAAFADLHGARGEIAGNHLDRGRDALAKASYSAALREFKLALAPDPGNGALIGNLAQVSLAYGRPASARTDFTRALTRTPTAALYLGRALAAAQMGDARRSDADLAIAREMDSASAAKWQPTIQQALARRRTSSTPEAALAALHTAAAGAATEEQLVSLADEVWRANAPRRLRYDEIYQDRIRALSAAVRARPKDPAPLTAFAAYVIDEADNKGDRVEPRSGTTYYRWQLSREDDLGTAIRVAQAALTLDARYAPAMIQQALALTALRKYDDAEALADRALAINPNDADALRLYARFRAARAADLSSQAAGARQDRCSSNSHTEDRSDGVYEVTETTCYPPSQGDLQRANALDAQANELARRAQAAIDRAVRATSGTLEGDLLQADVALASGNARAAENSLQHALKLNPASVEAQEDLAQLYFRTGRTQDAELQLAVARKLVQTTAAPLLRLAWTGIQKTAWAGSDQLLTQAQAYDLTDARVPAYRSVVRAGQGRAADAMAELRVAIALDEARVRADEPAVLPARPLARDPADFAVAMEARLRLAAIQRASAAVAVNLLHANFAYENRIPQPLYATQMFGAMWPDAKPEGGAMVPAPVNASTLIAQGRLLAGRILIAAGRMDDARVNLQVAADLGQQPGTVRIGNGRGDSNFSGFAVGASGDAMIELAAIELQAGHNRKAFDLIQASIENKPSADQRERVNRMNEVAVTRLNQGMQDSPPAQRAPSSGPTSASGGSPPNGYPNDNRTGYPTGFDSRLAGSWQGMEHTTKGDQQIRLDIDGRGRYRYVSRTGEQLSGLIMTQGSQMKLQSDRGVSEASYQLNGVRALEINGVGRLAGWVVQLQRLN